MADDYEDDEYLYGETPDLNDQAPNNTVTQEDSTNQIQDKVSDAPPNVSFSANYYT